MKKIEAIIGIKEIPVILCDEWTPAQVKAFRLMVNRSATWADWDDDLLKLELLDLKTSDFNLALTGFDTKEIDDLILNDAPEEDALPPVPVKPVSCVGDLWICGSHRVLCGDATDPQAVSRLLGDQKPFLMVVDPPYGIELDSEWRDRARTEQTRTRRTKLFEASDQGAPANDNLRRHARRLVGGICAGSESRSGVRMACVEIHARGS